MTEYEFRVVDLQADPEAAYEAAADAVARGEVIVLPTDTVYGVGADPFSPDAVQRLLDAKRRGRDMPPPVLVAEVDMVRALVTGIDDRAEKLAYAFWPGALTIIGTAQESLQMDLGDRGLTIAVRVPAHEGTRELLRRTGPLAVSSANLNGQDAALTITEAVDQLGGSVSVYVDGGEMSGPVPSTIVDLSGPRPRLLRAGRITVAEINEVVPGLLEETEPIAQAEAEASETQAEFGAESDATETPAEPGASEPQAFDAESETAVGTHPETSAIPGASDAESGAAGRPDRPAAH